MVKVIGESRMVCVVELMSRLLTTSHIITEYGVRSTVSARSLKLSNVAPGS